jgi:hypothetical protein
VIDGVDYAIDVTQPARYDESGALVAPEARRVRGLIFRDAPVDPNQLFLVVTNNYRASGGGGFRLRWNKRRDRGSGREPRRGSQIRRKQKQNRAEIGRRVALCALA